MLYKNADDWRNAPEKRVMLFAMSGLGKTYISNLLRAEGNWFHYSVDYRIGTRYMGEHIADNFKREAMKSPLLRKLLLSDSVVIQSNITFNNLAPLSSYLGKPGDAAKGGVPWQEYLRRQDLHRQAEANAMLDTAYFIERAKTIYNYSNFVCDTSGSICEIVEPDNAADPVLSSLASNLLMVWIEGSESHTQELIRRFDAAPKPMCYQPEFLENSWAEYLSEKSVTEDVVDPDDFVRWAYARALAHRQPRYRAIAENWGVTVQADDIAAVRSEEDMVELLASALEAKG